MFLKLFIVSRKNQIYNKDNRLKFQESKECQWQCQLKYINLNLICFYLSIYSSKKKQFLKLGGQLGNLLNLVSNLDEQIKVCIE